MAKIDVSFDTVSKELNAFIDGSPLPAVESVTFDNFGNLASMWLHFEDSKVDGMNFRNSITATEYPGKDKKKKGESRGEALAFTKGQYFLLLESDGHTHLYIDSSPFSTVADGHFHGVIGDEVISADDHTHAIAMIDSMSEVNIHSIAQEAQGSVFDFDNAKAVYVEHEERLYLCKFNLDEKIDT